MLAALIVLAVIVFVVVFTLWRTVRVIPQAHATVVERLGRYYRTLNAGMTIVIPFVDRVKPLIDLREQVVSFPPRPVITEDNLGVEIDTVLYFQVTDPRSATYEIADYLAGIEQLTGTTLRNVIGVHDARARRSPRATRSTASCAACSTRRPGSGASASTASS